MATIIAKNITASGVTVPDLSGVYIGPYDEVELTTFFPLHRIEDSLDLDDWINADIIRINDGVRDLTKDESLEHTYIDTDYEVPKRFISLLDTPSTFSGIDYVFLKVNQNRDGVEFTPINFTDLYDVPTYSGHAGDIVIVNNYETGLDYMALSCGGKHFDAYSTDNDVDISSGWADVPLNAERQKSIDFTHNTDSAEVTITSSGTYTVIARVSTKTTVGTGRSDSVMRVVADSGSGYAEVDGTLGYIYNRNVDQGKGTSTVAFTNHFNANDKIKVQAGRNSGSSTIKLAPEGSSLTIFTTEGLRGPKGNAGEDGQDGAPGSGSTVGVKKDGQNVSGTTFHTLNFEGFDFVESTASGTVTISGCCDDAGGGDPADGVLWGESDGTSSTNSESYQQKLRVTFTPEYGAYYEVTSSCLYSHEDTGVFCFIRIQVDDSTTKKEMVRELYNFKYEDGAWSPYSSNFVIWLDATEHTIDMDYCQDDNPKTMYIKEAVITARRI